MDIERKRELIGPVAMAVIEGDRASAMAGASAMAFEISKSDGGSFEGALVAVVAGVHEIIQSAIASLPGENSRDLNIYNLRALFLLTAKEPVTQ